MEACEAFNAVAEMVLALGEFPLAEKHEGCFLHRVDERWVFAINGHREAKKCRYVTGPMSGESEPEVEIMPFNCFVWYNGWPAGYFDPSGGIIAGGEAANEAAFIEAVKAATEKVKSQTAQTSKQSDQPGD